METPPRTLKTHKAAAKRQASANIKRKSSNAPSVIPKEQWLSMVKLQDPEPGAPESCIHYKQDDTLACSIGWVREEEPDVLVVMQPLYIKVIIGNFGLDRILQCQNRRGGWTKAENVIIPDVELWNRVCSAKQAVPEWLEKAENFKQFMEAMEQRWRQLNPTESPITLGPFKQDCRRTPCVPAAYAILPNTEAADNDDVEEDENEAGPSDSEKSEPVVVEDQEPVVIVDEPPKKIARSEPKERPPPSQKSSSPKRQKTEAKRDFSELCTEDFEYSLVSCKLDFTKRKHSKQPTPINPAKIYAYIKGDKSEVSRHENLARLICIMELIVSSEAKTKTVPMKILMPLGGLQYELSTNGYSMGFYLSEVQTHIKLMQTKASEISDRINEEKALHAVLAERVGKYGLISTLLEMRKMNQHKFNWLLYSAWCALEMPLRKDFAILIEEKKIYNELYYMKKLVKKKQKEAQPSATK